MRHIDYKYPELIKYLIFKDEKLMLKTENVRNFYFYLEILFI